MISHSHKFIFIPVRRAAGTSIATAMGDYGEKGFDRGVLTHNWYSDIERYRDYFVFTAIRNPWDRFVSGYFWSDKSRKYSGKQVRFEKFINNLPTKESNYFWWFHTARTLTEMLIDRDGKFIADFTIRFENLKDDFRSVCKKLGFDRPMDLPHKLKTNHEHYSTYYNNRTRDKVAKRFKSDIDYFGYEFE